MSLQLADDVSEDAAEAAVAPAPAGHPVWPARLGVAALLFIAAGVFVALAALWANPLRNADVLSAGLTLAVAGAVLRSIASASAD